MILFNLIFVPVVHEYPLTAVTSFNDSPLRVHKCISWRVYEQFPGDHHAPNLVADVNTSCDESESGSDSDMEDIISTTSLINIVNVSTPIYVDIECHTYTRDEDTQ